MLEKKYFSLPELVERWGINIHNLLYLAENKLFNLKVRAFNICGTWCQNQTNAGISYERPLKSGEMSGLFPISLKSARQIMINQAVELTKLLTDIRLGETLKLSMEYIYGKVQSAIVKQLYEAAKDGRI